MLAMSGTLTFTETREMSYQVLRNVFLPVTSTARQEAVAQGFPLTDFRQLRDQRLTLSQGWHGVWETYDTTPAGSTGPRVRGRRAG